MKTNHRKDEMGVHGCEYAVSMVEHLPIELEALLKAAESKDGES